jgi:uncharacterized protein
MSHTVAERLPAIVFSLVIACALFLIAYWKGYFQLPPIRDEKNSRVHLTTLGVFGAFIVYIFSGKLLFSLIMTGQPVHSEELNGQGLLLYGLITACALSLYYAKYEPAIRQQIWGTGYSNRTFFLGVLTCLMVYPSIMLNSQLTSMLLEFLHLEPSADQVAVKLLKLSSKDFFQLIPMLISSIVIVPWLEELMFRGFLLAWLKTLFGRLWAIFASSALFALFHYSASQGYENVGLLSSIFILGGFLGFLKERQQSLWAPIGLHFTFNLIGSLIVLAEQGT